MAKNQTNVAILETAPEADALIGPLNLDPYGTMEPAPFIEPTNKKKASVRDYKKTPEVVKILEQYSSKSEAIRGLKGLGYEKGEIADMLRIRYQHVHNVLNQVLKGKKS